MAGTVAVTVTTIGATGVTRYDIDWTSDASGDVNSNPFDVRGHVFQIRFKPDSGGTQPSDQYDVSLKDANGVDLLDDGSGTSRGANRSNAAGSYMQWDPAVFMDGSLQLDLVVANAGNAKGGVVSVWVRD